MVEKRQRETSVSESFYGKEIEGGTWVQGGSGKEEKQRKGDRVDQDTHTWTKDPSPSVTITVLHIYTFAYDFFLLRYF